MTENAFETVPGAPESKLLLLCDHASSALPPGMGSLGLKPELFATHIAQDIGAAAVTRALAAAYGAPALLGAWSRLLIDLNRGADDPTIVMKLSDGSIIPRQPGCGCRRGGAPHRFVARALSRRDHRRAGPDGAGCGDRLDAQLHAKLETVPRPWAVGVLYDSDARLAAPLMARLEAAGFVVGDNEPYHGALDGDTLNVHGIRRGLPHVLIEIRQDLVADDAKAQAFAVRLKPILDMALADLKNPQE